MTSPNTVSPADRGTRLYLSLFISFATVRRVHSGALVSIIKMVILNQ